MDKQEFIRMISACAVKNMGASGILASVTIAQAILESSYGTSELAVNANNLFGMKCSLSGNTWSSVWNNVSKYLKATKEQDKDGKETTVHAEFRRYDSIEESVADHALYLLGAKKGNDLRFKHIANNKDPRSVIQIIKDGGYATDVNYVDKVMSVIEKYDLTQYDHYREVSEMTITEKIAVNNPCYKNNTKIKVKGLMLHSVGCPQPDPVVFANTWNKPTASVCAHAVVGAENVVYATLPFDVKAWHCGKGSKGSGNDMFVSLEMTEPASIKYTKGSQWIETGNGANTKAHVLATYNNAVLFFAFLCRKYDLNPLDDGVILSHREGSLRGLSSNHGDVEHIWSKFGLTMDMFRADVAKSLNGPLIAPLETVDRKDDDTSSQKINPLVGSITVIYEGDDGMNLRVSPSITAKIDDVACKGAEFNVTGISKDEKWYRLSCGLFISAIPDYVKFKAFEEHKATHESTGYFRVREDWKDEKSQIGAFKAKENAIELCKQNTGYRVFNDEGIEVYPLSDSLP